MLIKASKAIMDPNINAFSSLPKTVRFQLMVVLSCLWSLIFCVEAGLIMWLPGYVLAHTALLAIGIFGTSWAFKSAANRNFETHEASQ